MIRSDTLSIVKDAKRRFKAKKPHDSKMCSCDSYGVDGGISAGNRILGKLGKIESRACIEQLKEILAATNYNRTI